MGHSPNGTQVEPLPIEELRARILAVMTELQLPAPERMLKRIEKMLLEELGKKDHEQVLRQLLADFQQQSRSEVRRILKVLAPGRDEWAREVDRLLESFRHA